MSAATKEMCNGCRFWLPDLESGSDNDKPHVIGLCRRYPPRVSEHMAAIAIGLPRFGQQFDPDDLASSWALYDSCLLPATYFDAWCGEFRPAETER